MSFFGVNRIVGIERRILDCTSIPTKSSGMVTADEVSCVGLNKVIYVQCIGDHRELVLD